MTAGTFIEQKLQQNQFVLLNGATGTELGAAIIGGCCGIGPAHIRELKRRFCS